MTDDTGDRWTIRGIDHDAKMSAIAAAKRQRMTLGEWVSSAIRMHAASDQATPGAHLAGRPMATPGAQELPPDLDEARVIVEMIGELSDSGAEVPQAVAAAAYGLLEARLTAIRAQVAGGRLTAD